MKTLLQINSVVNWGSTGHIAENIAKMAIEDGWNSYIAYGRKKGVSNSKLIKIGTIWDVFFHVLMTRLFDKHGFASKCSTQKLIKTIERIKPDIVHLHNVHGYYVNIELLFTYLQENKIPVVWTLHDCWAFTGHCSHFDYIGCDKWKTQCFKCPQLKEYPQSYMDNSRRNYLLKKIHFSSIPKIELIPVSNWLGQLAQHSFLGKYPMKIIYNGIDLTVFYPRTNFDKVKTKYNIKKSFVIIGLASVWNERKGLNDFIKLSSILPENSSVVLVGLTKEQMGVLPSNIVGITRTDSQSELAELYSLADVFVNPTWEDNFPTTNLEALACGTPVISYNTGGSVEAVSLETGLIVEKGNIKELAKAIDTIRINKKSSYSQACRKRAEECFDKNERYREYICLYEKLLNHN